MPFSPAVLPLIDSNRVYHLQLAPEELADTVITVGDQERVDRVSRHFDSIEHRITHREFVTHTGYLNGKRLTVISTGIGTSNIDIVLNELDALKNIDLGKREQKAQTQSLTIVRFGTTGGLSTDTPLGSIVVTEAAIGLDGLLHYYERPPARQSQGLEEAFINHMGEIPIKPYGVFADKALVNQFKDLGPQGITATCMGFYGPQDRKLRYQLAYDGLIQRLSTFQYEGLSVLNFEMETAAILGLGQLLGHRCLSIATVLAHRCKDSFVDNVDMYVDKMIEKGLEKLLTC